MRNKSPLSIELYNTLVQDGYGHQFATLITDNLNTDFAAGRMLGYLAHYDHLPEVEIADELELASGAEGWVDICKGWNDNE